MSKYNKFEDFMQSVINDADSKCRSRYGKSLADAYDVNTSIVKMILAIISNGWWVFVALVAILVLGPFAFGASLLTFVATPPGMIIVGALTIFGVSALLRCCIRTEFSPLQLKRQEKCIKMSLIVISMIILI